jgi:tetratricopeptide (TPR) repeat protein
MVATGGPATASLDETLTAYFKRMARLFEANNYVEAEAVGNEFLTVARKSGQMTSVAQALRGLALIASMRGEYFHSEQLLDEAQRIAEDFELRGELGRVLYARSVNQERLGLLDDAEQTLGIALMHANQAGDKHAQATIHVVQGEIAHWQARFDEAYQYNMLAFDLHSEATEAHPWPMALIYAGKAALELGWDAEASAAFDKASTLSGHAGYELDMSWAMAIRAQNCLLIDELETARELMAAAQLQAKHQEIEIQLFFELVRGKLAVALGELHSALDCFAKAKRFAQQHQSRFLLAEVRLAHAHALILTGKLEHAACVLMDAQMAFEMLGARSYLAQTFCIWTTYYMALGRQDAARAALRRAKDQSKQLEPHPGRSLTAALAQAQAAVRG